MLAVLAICFVTLGTHAEDKPAYLRRGDEIEKVYKTYTKRLDAAYRSLRAALKAEFPDLYKKLKGTPPKPVEYGYQILPKLTPDSPESRSGAPPRASSSSYTWRRTLSFIDWELPKIEEFEEKLGAVKKMTPADRRAVFETMVRDYPKLESTQQLIDHHIQYNRFWQKAIADDKPRFDRLTVLHDAVLERQALLDKLAAGSDNPELREREAKLAQQIHEQNEHVRPAAFLRVRRHPEAKLWVLHVPVYSDIRNTSFLDAMVGAIEKVWAVDEKDASYRLKIGLRRISPKKLYAGAAPPKRGEHLDVSAHVARFPEDGAVITTGSNSTYAIPARFIALGPQDISHNVMAHEFGHILGFIDGYFRGYRDLKDEGFEVLEIVPDADDIMCTPGAGFVRKHHFEKLIKFARTERRRKR